MPLPDDKRKHLIAGALIAAGALALVWLSTIALGLAVAAAGAAVGVAYEAVQRLRGEGTPELADAAATALPGVLLGLTIHFTGWQPW